MSKAKPSPIPLILIATASVAFGVLVHVMAVHKGPQRIQPNLMAMSEAQMLQQLGLSPGSKINPVLSRLSAILGGNRVSKLTWLLVIAFRDTILVRPLGKALLIYLLAIAAPLMYMMAGESVSPRRGKRLGPGTLIFVTALGQVITIGSATTIFWVPLLAAARWSQVTKTPEDRLAPGPTTSNSALALVCTSLTGVTAIASSVIPTTSPYWVWANLAFQFFPVAFIPLVFTAPRRSAPLVKGSSPGRSIWELSPPIGQIIFQGLAIFVAWPQLQSAWQQGGGHIPGALQVLWRNRIDGEHILIWDGLGLAFASWSAILIEREADRIAAAGGEKKIHPTYNTIADIVLSLPTAVVIGQGFITARFFSQRDERVAAARKTVSSKSQ